MGDNNAARIEGVEVHRPGTPARQRDHAQLRQAFDQFLRKSGALAHGDDDLETGQGRSNRIGILERLLEKDDFRAFRQARPVRADLRHTLPIVKNGNPRHCHSSGK